MKIHGYADDRLETDVNDPAELGEITLVATPDELRRIARFLGNCANEMEARGSSWEHQHLLDEDSYFKNSPILLCSIRSADNNPKIAYRSRPMNTVEVDNQEIVSGPHARGYIALYRYIAESNTVFLLALGNRREAGYTNP